MMASFTRRTCLLSTGSGLLVTAVTGCGERALPDGFPQAIEPIETGTTEGLDALIRGSASPLKLVSSGNWLEGPLWQPEASRLLFVQFHPAAILALDDSGRLSSLYPTARDLEEDQDISNPAARLTGLAFLADHDLLLCDLGAGYIGRFNTNEPAISVVFDEGAHGKLRGPNDLIFDQAGRLLFSDPGLDRLPGEAPPCVYRTAGDGLPEALAEDLPRPNGLGFSPDGKTLYVTNTDPAAPVVYSYDLDGELPLQGRLFADFRELISPTEEFIPDGMAVAQSGEMAVALHGGGIAVLAPNGDLIGRIQVDAKVSNCCFGGPGNDVLYITGFGVWSLQTMLNGLQLA